MQGYVLEVKKYVYRSFFVDSNFIMACFGWMLLNTFFSSHKKELFSPQKSPFLRPRCSEDHGPVPLLEYTQSYKEPCDRMNNKTQLYYHKLSHTSHMMLLPKQAEQLN